MHHISASECVGWVMLQSLHTPWALCRIFDDVSTGTAGFTELGQDCFKVKLKQSQFHSCAPRLKSPRVRLWQNTLLSETRHTRSIISYCEKQISISLSPHHQKKRDLFSGVAAAVQDRKLLMEQRGPVKPDTGFQRRCETISPVPKRSVWGERNKFSSSPLWLHCVLTVSGLHWRFVTFLLRF